MKSFGELVSDIHNIIENEENSIKGYRFEKWVVKNTSLYIAIYEGGKEVVRREEGDWLLREWRSDKSVDYSEDASNVAMPISSLAPDLMLEATKDLYGKGGWRKGDVIFVECKWCSSGKFSLKERQRKNYEFALKRHFTKRKTKPLEHLFYVFGYDWDKDKNEPNDVVCILATTLYQNLSTRSDKNFSIEELKEWGVPLIDRGESLIDKGNIPYARYENK